MKIHEIEDWALRVIKKVRSGVSVEDSRTELKRQFTDPEKAARRIAGHANSAGGEPILWIIGIDDKTGELFNVKDDIGNWWSSVQSRFDGLAPTLRDVTISIEDKNLRALFFETDRRPFLVKASAIKPELEVPWRDGTRVRSANRNDLIQLLTSTAGDKMVWKIREDLAPLLAEGAQLKNKCGPFGRAAIDHQALSISAHSWAEKTVKYLSANVGQMAVVKFENATHRGVTSHPGAGWDNFMFISARVAGLQHVLNNLSDYVSP